MDSLRNFNHFRCWLQSVAFVFVGVIFVIVTSRVFGDDESRQKDIDLEPVTCAKIRYHGVLCTRWVCSDENDRPAYVHLFDDIPSMTIDTEEASFLVRLPFDHESCALKLVVFQSREKSKFALQVHSEAEVLFNRTANMLHAKKNGAMDENGVCQIELEDGEERLRVFLDTSTWLPKKIQTIPKNGSAKTIIECLEYSSEKWRLQKLAVDYVWHDEDSLKKGFLLFPRQRPQRQLSDGAEKNFEKIVEDGLKRLEARQRFKGLELVIQAH